MAGLPFFECQINTELVNLAKLRVGGLTPSGRPTSPA